MADLKQYAANMRVMTKQIKMIRETRHRVQAMTTSTAIPTPAPVDPTIEELRDVQQAACALAAAAQSECDFYTDLIVKLEPP